MASRVGEFIQQLYGVDHGLLQPVSFRRDTPTTLMLTATDPWFIGMLHEFYYVPPRARWLILSSHGSFIMQHAICDLYLWKGVPANQARAASLIRSARLSGVLRYDA